MKEYKTVYQDMLLETKNTQEKLEDTATLDLKSAENKILEEAKKRPIIIAAQALAEAEIDEWEWNGWDIPIEQIKAAKKKLTFASITRGRDNSQTIIFQTEWINSYYPDAPIKVLISIQVGSSEKDKNNE